MGNEPSFVDGGDAPTGRPIYYHSGLDIGGCEGLVDVVSASDGLVVSAGGKALPEYPDIPFYKRATTTTSMSSTRRAGSIGTRT